MFQFCEHGTAIEGKKLNIINKKELMENIHVGACNYLTQAIIIL